MDLKYVFRYTPPDESNGRKKRETLNNKVIAESELSADQKVAYDQIVRWVRDPTPLLTMGGYAGTGKSTLLSLLAARFSQKRIAFAAYTGKAAGILRQRIAPQENKQHYVGTIHSLMYFPVTDELTGEVKFWARRHNLTHDLIIVDEASMLDEKLYKDLASYEIPILAVGDHGQLPPVMGSFNLMDAPMLRLEQIHRLAQDNPIIQLSEQIRQTGDLPNGLIENDNVRYVARSEFDKLVAGIYLPENNIDIEDTAILCYRNKTRQSSNELVRQVRLGKAYQSSPVVGDQVICLRNAGDTVFNGMRGMVETIHTLPTDPHHYFTRLYFPSDYVEFEGPISAHQFGRPTFTSFENLEEHGLWGVSNWEQAGLLMDYGYALTVHKAQGSAFSCVVLLYEHPSRTNSSSFRRWLYTGVTRCSDYLLVVLP